jgi:hypothetical protein
MERYGYYFLAFITRLHRTMVQEINYHIFYFAGESANSLLLLECITGVNNWNQFGIISFQLLNTSNF